MTSTDAESLQRVGTVIDRALWAVAGLALVFTCANVTRFAVHHGVWLPIAILLDPMVSLALLVVLLGDGRLARFGLRPTGWGVALRWFAALATWAMNVWVSVMPPEAESAGRLDIAGVVLHSVPPLLLIVLTEAASGYRRRIADVMRTALGTAAPVPAPAGTPQSVPGTAVPNAAAPSAVPTRRPVTRPRPPVPASTPDIAVSRDLLERAREVDRQHRAKHGGAATARVLRTELHVGQSRALELRRALLAGTESGVLRLVPGDSTGPGTDIDTDESTGTAAGTATVSDRPVS